MRYKLKAKNTTYGLVKLMVFMGIIGVSACAEHNREYSPDLRHFEPRDQMTADYDMYTSPSLEIYEETDLFENGLTAQKPVAGTIPRGFTPYPYPDNPSGYERAGEEWKNPFESTPEVLAKGEDLYTKFCAHCHGVSGRADGPVIQIGKFPPPPSFIDGNSSGGGKLIDLSEGKMFHSITYGRNMMGSHASQINHDERWMIISFIKELQKEAGVQEDAAPVVEEDVVNAEMTKEDRITAGESIYMRICMACHQVNGQGIPAAFPPLANSDYLNADIERAIGIVANGQQGEMVVNGKTYNGVMVDNGLTPDEIANVLTYVLNNWGNSGGVVTPEQTKNARNK